MNRIIIELSLVIHKSDFKWIRHEYEVKEAKKYSVVIERQNGTIKNVPVKQIDRATMATPPRLYGANPNGSSQAKYKVWCYPENEEAAKKTLIDRMHEIADVYMKKAIEFKDVCHDLDEVKRCNGACHDNSSIVGFTKCECEAK